MKKPTTEEMRAAAFVFINAGRELEQADAGRTGRDDDMAARLVNLGIELYRLTERGDSVPRQNSAVEALRRLSEGVNYWEAHINGDLA